MIRFFRHNDIVLNFYRSVAYRFDRNNPQHLKDSGRCRLAVFEEIESFNKHNKTGKVMLEYLFGGKVKKWQKQNIKIEVLMFDRIMSAFLKLSEDIETTDYSLLISELIRRCDHNVFMKELRFENKQLKQKIKNQETKLKNIDKLLNNR